jgi:hypothetical protein
MGLNLPVELWPRLATLPTSSSVDRPPPRPVGAPMFPCTCSVAFAANEPCTFGCTHRLRNAHLRAHRDGGAGLHWESSNPRPAPRSDHSQDSPLVAGASMER